MSRRVRRPRGADGGIQTGLAGHGAPAPDREPPVDEHPRAERHDDRRDRDEGVAGDVHAALAEGGLDREGDEHGQEERDENGGRVEPMAAGHSHGMANGRGERFGEVFDSAEGRGLAAVVADGDAAHVCESTTWVAEVERDLAVNGGSGLSTLCFRLGQDGPLLRWDAGNGLRGLRHMSMDGCLQGFIGGLR